MNDNRPFKIVIVVLLLVIIALLYQLHLDNQKTYKRIDEPALLSA